MRTILSSTLALCVLLFTGTPAVALPLQTPAPVVEKAPMIW